MLSSYNSIKKISNKLRIKPNTVYVTRKRYIKKGLLNEDNSLTSKGFDILKTTIGSFKTVKSKVKSDTIRLHNLVFILSIPKLRKWNKHREFLIWNNIKFEELPLKNWNGERIIIDKIKVWLTNKTIILYMPQYIAKDEKEDANIVFLRALDDLLLRYVPKLERLLKISLKDTNGYKIRVSRQHYSLMKNALAIQYHKEGKKLYVRDEKGLWLVIDNSLNLKELETVHSKTARDDNLIVHDFFNDLKQNPLTPSEILGLFTKLSEEGIKPLTEQIKLHLEVQRETLITLKKIQENLKR
jgi:hypothetical protein